MLSSFSLVLTGECNFDCGYCYQARDGLSLDGEAVRKAVDFFFPWFDRECAVLFYGGEPLLRMETIRKAVEAVSAANREHEKKIEYSISTNGSLLDEAALDFFEENQFTVLLSFDGRAQDKGRKKGSYRLVSGALDRLLRRPAIELLTNSVFTPETVADLSASVREIVERGVRDAQVSFTNHVPWGRDALARLQGELSELRLFLSSVASRTGALPVANFRRSPEPGLFGCLAGRTRMALSPDGRLWGCHLFYDLHRKARDPTSARYSFGTLDSFIARHERSFPRTLPRYADLRMDYFHTPRRFCGSCPDLEDCVVCPVDAAFSSGIIGRITSDDCRIRRMIQREKRLLSRDLVRRGDRTGKASGPASE